MGARVRLLWRPLRSAALRTGHLSYDTSGENPRAFFAVHNSVVTITPRRADLDRLVAEALEAARVGFPEVGEGDLRAAVVQIGPEGDLETGHVRGDIASYPASVVKLFHLAYLMHVLEEGRASDSDELRRARLDMIRDSSNDATALVVDTYSGTTGGPELSPDELVAFMGRRREIDEWYSSLGYEGVRVRQKTWGDGSYGRERQAAGPNRELANSFTPLHAARLIAEIATGLVVPSRSGEMTGLLSRFDRSAYQVSTFLGAGLPEGWGLWSKAGWAYDDRHDVALVRSPEGRRWSVAVFTKGHPDLLDLWPVLGRELFERLAASP